MGGWFGGTVVQPSTLACSIEISKHLTNSTRANGIERWDLVHYSTSFGQLVDSEASILVNGFEAIDHNEDKIWEKWSKDYPAQAAILWPAIQKLAIHRAYFAIPELLHFAATSPTKQDLADHVERISRLAAADQVARLVEKKDFSEARLTLEWGESFGSAPEFDRLEVLIQKGFAEMAKAKK